MKILSCPRPFYKNGVGKYLDASMCHVTQKDDSLFKLASTPGSTFYGYCPIFIVAHDAGYWIHTLHSPSEIQKLGNHGFSPDVTHLIEFAKARGCTWVNLDSDGYVHPALNKHDW